MAIKDLYAVKGLKTSLNNLSYYDTSEKATASAAVIDSLLRDSAHILGLTKLSSMIAREEPMDAVDFHTAFNPRETATSPRQEAAGEAPPPSLLTTGSTAHWAQTQAGAASGHPW